MQTKLIHRKFIINPISRTIASWLNWIKRSIYFKDFIIFFRRVCVYQKLKVSKSIQRMRFGANQSKKNDPDMMFHSQTIIYTRRLEFCLSFWWLPNFDVYYYIIHNVRMRRWFWAVINEYLLSYLSFIQEIEWLQQCCKFSKLNPYTKFIEIWNGMQNISIQNFVHFHIRSVITIYAQCLYITK